MADIEFTQGVAYGDDDPDAQRGAGLRTFTNVAGAAMSLALIVGIGVWGYKLLVRDVSGVPVVRALEGPMRVQPDNPGGQPADNQGLAVNAVAADGTAEAPADRLILAPKPVVLQDEDLPQSAIAQSGSDTESESATETAAMPDADTAQTISEGAIDAVISQVVNGSESAEITQPDPLAGLSTGSTASTTAEPAPKIVTGPGVKRSLRPQIRPIKASFGRAAAPAAAERTSVVLDVDPTTLPAGTRLAQLGAYDSADVAKAEWDRLNRRFGDYLEGKRRVIQKTTSGGRTFYRLRAMGFADLSDARRFCSALVSENADCIPVVAR